MALERDDRRIRVTLVGLAVCTLFVLLYIKIASDLMLVWVPWEQARKIFLGAWFYGLAFVGLFVGLELLSRKLRVVIRSLQTGEGNLRNLLLEPVAYKVEETRFGVWRRFVSERSGRFEEFVSHQRLFGLPLLHYVRGRCPEMGWPRCALGVVAIGQWAVGVVAVGQFSAGLVAVGQVAIGVMLGFGQATTGMVAIGQAALGVAFGLGQGTTGYVAIGQGATGTYVLAQKGFGRFVWDMSGCSPVARQFFESLIP